MIGEDLPVFTDPDPGMIDLPKERSDPGITARVHRAKGKARLISAMKQEAAREILPALPEPGYHYHIISNGKSDFWTWIPVIASYMGTVEEFYASTWSLNRANTTELLDLLDQGRIRNATVLTGLYFKRRETAVYATLVEGLLQRGQRYRALPTHAKISLLGNEDHHITIEGSANWTGNPQIEQYVITDDPEIYGFHRAWMEEVCRRKERTRR